MKIRCSAYKICEVDCEHKQIHDISDNKRDGDCRRQINACDIHNAVCKPVRSKK
jgi:hypothetical protein